MSYTHGFAASPCQVELANVEIGRLVCNIVGVQSTTNRRDGATVEKATKSEILAIVLAFISIFVVMMAGFTGVWLTSEVRVIGLVLLPTAIVAGLLVVYFDWRAKLRN